MYCLNCGNIFDVDLENVERLEFKCPNCGEEGVYRQGSNGVSRVIRGDFTPYMDQMLSIEYSHLEFEENKGE